MFDFLRKRTEIGEKIERLLLEKPDEWRVGGGDDKDILVHPELGLGIWCTYNEYFRVTSNLSQAYIERFYVRVSGEEIRLTSGDKNRIRLACRRIQRMAKKNELKATEEYPRLSARIDQHLSGVMPQKTLTEFIGDK